MRKKTGTFREDAQNNEKERVMNFDLSYFVDMVPSISSTLNVTMSLTLIALVFSLMIGAVVAIAEYYKIGVLNQICRAYVSIFRGTPLLPQLFFFYFGVAYFSEFVRNMSPFAATAVVLSLNMGAYMAENIRGALMAIDSGQIEAAFSFGMSRFQTMRRVIAPQALRIAFPSLFNNLIDLLKGSSIAFVVGVVDIMGKAKLEAAITFRFFEVYAAVMLIYWVIITILSFFQRKVEAWCNSAY